MIEWIEKLAFFVKRYSFYLGRAESLKWGVVLVGGNILVIGAKVCGGNA